MRFEEAYTDWQTRRLTQEEAARLLGVHERTFRRYIDRYDEEGLEGLIDKHLAQVSHRRAPVDEVIRLEALYRERYEGWNIKHFYSWVRNRLQTAGLVKRTKDRGRHRKRRERAPLPGMRVHQDGSRHQWVTSCYRDLIVTMDDATGEHYSMFFIEEEGTASSFRGVRETLSAHGLFCSLYTDRGSHYWYTPEAGGKVDKGRPTLARLGIELISAYSPEARGGSERAFATHQGRLAKRARRQGH